MAASLLSSNRAKLIYSCCWVILALVQAGILFWLDIDPETSLIDSAVTNGLLMALCTLISNNLQFYQPEKGKYSYVVVWCMLLAVIWLAVSHWVLTGMIHNDATPNIEVDPETYEVRADGELLTCAPADVLPMAQRYFLF